MKHHFKFLSLAVAIMLGALAIPAHATGIGFGNTYNTTNNTTNNEGGTGLGIGIAGANADANASVKNDVKNTNAQGQLQGQMQGQQQGQGQQQNAISNSGGNKLTNEGNNAAQKTDVAVVVEGNDAAKIPVATAYAAPLTASNGTCMGSTSGGGQGLNLGLSFGTTWTDEDCDRRYDSQELRAQGHVKAATALMCQKASIAEAMKAAGTPCPGDSKSASTAPSQQQEAVAQKPQYTDPIIRKRLGLPPL